MIFRRPFPQRLLGHRLGNDIRNPKIDGKGIHSLCRKHWVRQCDVYEDSKLTSMVRKVEEMRGRGQEKRCKNIAAPSEQVFLGMILVNRMQQWLEDIRVSTNAFALPPFLYVNLPCKAKLSANSHNTQAVGGLGVLITGHRLLKICHMIGQPYCNCRFCRRCRT